MLSLSACCPYLFIVYIFKFSSKTKTKQSASFRLLRLCFRNKPPIQDTACKNICRNDSFRDNSTLVFLVSFPPFWGRGGQVAGRLQLALIKPRARNIAHNIMFKKIPFSKISLVSFHSSLTPVLGKIYHQSLKFCFITILVIRFETFLY